jgi:hypothetical protein
MQIFIKVTIMDIPIDIPIFTLLLAKDIPALIPKDISNNTIVKSHEKIFLLIC